MNLDGMAVGFAMAIGGHMGVYTFYYHWFVSR